MQVNDKHLSELLEFYTGHGRTENTADTTNCYACCYCPCYLRLCNVPEEDKKLSCKEKILSLLKEEELDKSKTNTGQGEKKLAWTDLKVGDVIRKGTLESMVMAIDKDNGWSFHLLACRYKGFVPKIDWINDKEIEEWEKVEDENNN